MKDQVLSIQQMQHLKELGVETSKASMCWVKDPNSEDRTISIHDEYCYEMSCLRPVPTFTLQNMLEMMPQNIDGHTLLVSKNATAYQNVGWSTMKVFCNEGILINTYNILCWLAENKLLGKESNGRKCKNS